MPLRWFVAAMLATCVAGQALCVEFPYVAYVNSSDVYVRSGPGRNYYPTDKLRKGEKVEVYRHDPGGWYAIRPPRNSFSWVSSRHLDPIGDGLAVVDGQKIVARVGSAFSEVRDVIQVRLDQGEKVELVEPPSGDSPWCKIAPPSGEFRWVFSKFVDRELPAETAEDETDAAAGGARSVRLTGGQADFGDEDSQPEAATARRAQSGAAPAVSRERELDRIDADLSAMAAEDISAWSFDELKRRTEVALSESQSSAESRRARVLLSKLARFQDIKQRHQAIRRGPPEGAAAAAAPPRRVEDPRFDGIGRLSPVISQKVGGPQYALVDGNNAVISFITPAPGVNLRPFVDKTVGVNGQRGYMTDMQRQHISVQRVTLLDVDRR